MSTIKLMLLAYALLVGFGLTVAIIIKAAEIGQDMLSFLWSCFRRR